MTAVIAVATGRFAVVAADQACTMGNDRYFAPKLRRVKGSASSGLVIAGSGQTGPIWRRLETDQKWRALRTQEEFFASVCDLAQSTYDGQQMSGHEPVESVAVISRDQISTVDNAGCRTLAARIPGQRATIEGGGSGRNFCLAYVLGHLAAMTPRQARGVLGSQQRLSALLRETIEACSRFDASVGGDVDVMVVK